MIARPRNGSKPHITLPEQPIEYWWDGTSSPESIEEDRVLSEYDCGYFDLGAESSTSATTSSFMENSGLVENWAGAVPQITVQRPSFRRASSPDKSRYKNYAVDRDCGICFEYAVVPCRTLCCGKIFCTEHLADWLHGPEAEGRCPNCENACSLEGGTLSLASPALLQARRNKPSPLTLVRPHSSDTLHPQAAAAVTTPTVNSSESSTSICSDYSETTVSTEEQQQQHHIHHTFPKKGPLASAFSLPWGVVSRLISILIFLMFLYKLRS